MVATTDSSAPLIVVFGATGTQGGSVIDHLISSPKPYRIRGVTRDPSKPSGKKLEERGCEVVKAEMGDQAQVEEAIKGSEIVFGVTNFWEHGGAKEVADGKILINAIENNLSTIKKYLWSGVMPVSKISNGKYTHVEHFDTKASLTELARKEGLPIIDVEPAMYMENFLSSFTASRYPLISHRMTRPDHPVLAHQSATKGKLASLITGSISLMLDSQQEDGYVFSFPGTPTSKLHLINCRRDYGAYVVGALESGKVQVGGEVLACAEAITTEELARQWGEGNNVKCSYVPAPAEQFKAVAGEEFTEMLQYFAEYGYYGGKDISPSQAVLVNGTKVQKWADFVKASDWTKVLSG